MKKKIFVGLVCLFFSFAASGCANNNSVVEKQPNNDSIADSAIVVCDLTREQCAFFLKSPSVDYLEKNTERFKYSIDPNNDKKIIFQKVTGTSAVAESIDGGVHRLSYTPIYCSLVEFWGSEIKVQEYLQNNNIIEHTNTVYFLCMNGLPDCIWISTETEWYFVTIDEQVEDIENNLHSDSFVYRLYRYDEFVSKFGVVDADLFVNEKRLLTVKMYYDMAEIPILALLEKLGANIQWEDANVNITYNNNGATIDTVNRIIKFKNGLEYGKEPPGGSTYFAIRESEIYIDTFIATDVLQEFGIELSWSREELAVNVKTKLSANKTVS